MYVIYFVIAFFILMLGKVESRPLEADNAEVSLQCIKRLRLTIEEVNDIAEKMSYAIIPEGGETFLQFLECFWKRKGFMNSEGDIEADNLRNCLIRSFQHDQELTSPSNSLAQIVVANCKDIKDENIGLKAAKVQNCITNYLIDMKSANN